jgi:hypothetical protein
MRANKASVNSIDELPSPAIAVSGAAGVLVVTGLTGGGGGAPGGKPTSPANVVVVMAIASNVAARRFLGNFIFIS